MRVTIQPGALAGTVSMLPSKSQLHRQLICAALARGETLICSAPTQAEDVAATIACLEALGAKITRREEGFLVWPLDRGALPNSCTLPCKESGSTLRFLLPVACALGIAGEFQMEGRLPQRPMEPLDGELQRHGIVLSRSAPHVLGFEGQLRPGDYTLPGNLSSQYITGLLMALPLLEGDSSLRILPPVESGDYIEMTLEVQAKFGLCHRKEGGRYHIQGGQELKSPGLLTVEGDWSNAAFWLCAGAMPGGDLRCGGLLRESRQGDRAVLPILEEMGAKICWEGETVRVSEGTRRAVTIDAGPIPDLIPALAVAAAVGEGVTVIRNAARLRLKESDRLTAVAQTLNALGAQVKELPEGLEIQGVPRLEGGTVDAWGDHRIAMMAAVASVACRGPVSVTGAQAVRKSYPHFWAELAALGKTVKEESL